MLALKNHRHEVWRRSPRVMFFCEKDKGLRAAFDVYHLKREFIMSRLRRNFIAVCCMLIALPALAQNGATKAENKLKDYFSGVALQVKKQNDPAQKREILNRSFEKVFKAADTIERMPAFSASDLQVVTELRSQAREKFDELNGLTGYQRINDAQLDHFADYIVQDMEQAKQITIVTTTAVLIVIGILVLLLAS